MRTGFFLSVLSALAILCTSCGRQEPKTAVDLKPKPWPELRVGYLPVAAELPLFVAVEHGFFTKAGPNPRGQP
jgi:ABC-type nitrate/sulfonate/bicarbonate transport system substrate-binding protein